MTSFYEAQAARFIEMSQDNDGNLFCTLPSERDMDIRYRLECKESKLGIEVSSCSCPSRKRPCKHLDIVQGFWARIYKSSNANLRKVG
jgi:hypothetical protein